MAKSRLVKTVLIVFVGLPLLCCTGIIGSCSARWPAKPTETQKTVIDGQGQAHKLRIWKAERVLKLPFFDDPSAFLEFNGKKYKVHGGDFGSGVGGLYQSRDKNLIVLARSFEGGETSGWLIDLQSGKVTEKDLSSDTPLPGWSELSWQTGLEGLTRQQLYDQFSSAELPKAVAAVEELEARGFDDADWLAMAKVFADRSAPARSRKLLGWDLVYLRENRAKQWRHDAYFGTTTMPANPQAELSYDRVNLNWPEDIVELVGSALSDSDRDIQTTAVWALAAMVPDAPERNVVRGELDYLLGPYVASYREWWAQRQARGSTSAPSTAPK